MQKYTIKTNNKPAVADNMKRIQLWHRYRLETLKMKLLELKKCRSTAIERQKHS